MMLPLVPGGTPSLTSSPPGPRTVLGHGMPVGSAGDVGLITEVGDDLQLAAERLDAGGEGVDLPPVDDTPRRQES